MRLIGRRAQSVSEYAVLAGVLAAAFGGMHLYMRRSIQASIKTAADQFSFDEAGVVDGELTQRDGVLHETRQDRRIGRITAQRARTDAVTAKQVQEVAAPSGMQVRVTSESVVTRGTLLPGGVASFQESTAENRH